MQLVLLASAPPAFGEPRIEVGGFVGGTTSKTRSTFECVRPISSDVCVSSSEPHYSKYGVTAGAVFRYPIVSVLLLEASVAYTQKGEDAGSAVTYHYLEVPLFLRVDSQSFVEPARPFALLGIAPAFEVACTASGQLFDNSLHGTFEFSGACDEYRIIFPTPHRFDIGAVAGLGIGLNAPFGMFEIQARYTHGLIDIQDDTGKTINRTFALVVGFSRAIKSLPR